MPVSTITSADLDKLITQGYGSTIAKSVEEDSIIMKVCKSYTVSHRSTQIPVTDTLAMAGFVNSSTGGFFSTTTADFSAKYLTLEKIGAIVIFDFDDLQDEKYDVKAVLKEQVRGAFSQVFDKAVLDGTNKPASWDDGLKQQAVSAGNVVTYDENNLYDNIFGPNGLFDLVERSGYVANAVIAYIGMKASLRSMKTTTGQPYYTDYVISNGKYVMEGAEVHYPRNGSVDPDQFLMMVGDFNKVLYAIGHDFTMDPINQGKIESEDGLMSVNLSSQHKIAIRFFMRVAWSAPNPSNRLNPDSATRFPVSVLIKPE